MSDWIEEFGENIEAEQKDKAQRAERADEIEHRLARFWNDLQYMLRDAVQKVNANEAIMKMIGDKLRYFEQNIFSVKIEKLTYPAIRLYVGRGQGRINVKRDIADLELDDNGYGDINRVTRTEEEEDLECYLDGEALQFRTKDQRVLRGEYLPAFLLKPLLVPCTPQRWIRGL